MHLSFDLVLKPMLLATTTSQPISAEYSLYMDVSEAAVGQARLPGKADTVE